MPKPLARQVAAPEEGRESAVSSVLWSILVTLGLASTITFMWVLAPAVRGFSFETNVAQPVLVAAGVSSLVLLVLAVALDSFATASQLGMAAVWAGTIGAISAFVFVYRLVVGSSQGTSLPPEQMAMWFGWCVLLLALTILPALSWRRRAHVAEARRGVSWRGDPDQRRDAKRVLDVARELAKRTSSGAVVTVEWERSLAALPDVDAEAVAQARTLGPVAWLVWTVYDGDIDVRALRIG